MERRVGRVLHEAFGMACAAAPAAPALGRHLPRRRRAPAARLRRAHRPDESFTIDDRGDAEDLIDLLRQELGLAAAKSRFPHKGTCLAIYSRVVNSRAPLADGAAATPSPGAAPGRTS